MDNRNVVVNEVIGQPETKKRKMMDLQPMHQVKQESNLQEEQGQSTLLLPAFKGMWYLYNRLFLKTCLTS